VPFTASKLSYGGCTGNTTLTARQPTGHTIDRTSTHWLLHCNVASHHSSCTLLVNFSLTLFVHSSRSLLSLVSLPCRQRLWFGVVEEWLLKYSWSALGYVLLAMPALSGYPLPPFFFVCIVCLFQGYCANTCLELGV
jgi:hypothetical protein